MKSFKEYFLSEAKTFDAYIMNASSVWSKGKLSAKDFSNQKDAVIFLGKKGSNPVAVIGHGGGSDPFSSYKFKKNEPINYTIDTGNGYKRASDELVFTDVIRVGKDGKLEDGYTDGSYNYWVFK